MANPKQEIKQLRQALKTALAKWQEADWHWSSEFGRVCAEMKEHVPEERQLFLSLTDLANGES